MHTLTQDKVVGFDRAGTISQANVQRIETAKYRRNRNHLINANTAHRVGTSETSEERLPFEALIRLVRIMRQ